MPRNPRSGRPTARLRRMVADRDGWICHRCRQSINPTLRHPHPGSVTLEHVLPDGLTLHEANRLGVDTYAPHLCTVSHRYCNLQAGGRVGGRRQHAARRRARMGATPTALTW